MGIHLKYVEDPEHESDTDVTGTNVKNRELNFSEKFSNQDCRLVLYLFLYHNFGEHLLSSLLEQKNKNALDKASSENIQLFSFFSFV